MTPTPAAVERMAKVLWRAYQESYVAEHPDWDWLGICSWREALPPAKRHTRAMACAALAATPKPRPRKERAK